MKKILFLALHLGYGGTEKAIIAEANILSECYDVEIACVYKLYEEPAFFVDKRVKVTYLSETLKPNREELKKAAQDKNIVAILKEGMKSIKVLQYRKAIIKKVVQNSEADIIISTRYMFHKILGKYKKPNVVTIAQEHNHHNNDENYIQKIIHSVQDINYFMPVSKELTEFYEKRMVKTKCIYIPHSLECVPKEVSPLLEPILISVGRLSKEKGFVDLIEIFAKISGEYPQWKLHIVGDGDERSHVEKMIEAYKLEGQVVLHGYQGKAYINQLLAKSSIYVMTSISEAFGIVLIEAQSFGIPCIAYDSAKGALEIINNGENGYLIPNRDKDEMCEKIKQLMDNLSLRKQLGNNGRENSLQYSTENIKKQWFEFIDTI